MYMMYIFYNAIHTCTYMYIHVHTCTYIIHTVSITCNERLASSWRQVGKDVSFSTYSAIRRSTRATTR